MTLLSTFQLYLNLECKCRNVKRIYESIYFPQRKKDKTKTLCHLKQL